MGMFDEMYGNQQDTMNRRSRRTVGSSPGPDITMARLRPWLSGLPGQQFAGPQVPQGIGGPNMAPGAPDNMSVNQSGTPRREFPGRGVGMPPPMTPGPSVQVGQLKPGQGPGGRGGRGGPQPRRNVPGRPR